MPLKMKCAQYQELGETSSGSIIMTIHDFSMFSNLWLDIVARHRITLKIGNKTKEGELELIH